MGEHPPNTLLAPQDLALLKATFDQIDEVHEITSKILATFTPQRLRILDVGCGNGKVVRVLRSLLEPRGYSFFVLALDINISSYKQNLANVALLEVDFMHYAPDGTFDIVLAIQSIYYFAPPLVALERLYACCNRSKGLVMIVLWSQECTLYRIAAQIHIAGEPSQLFAEKLYLQAKDTLPQSVITMSKVEGAVEIGKWISDAAISTAALRILRRRSLTEPTAATISEVVGSLPLSAGWAPRINGVIAISQLESVHM